MLDEVEGVPIGVLRAGQQRLSPGLGTRIDRGLREMSLENGPGDFTSAAARPPRFAGQPALEVSRQPNGQHR